MRRAISPPAPCTSPSSIRESDRSDGCSSRAIARGSDEVQGEIILCDRYGNLISNLTPADLAGDLAAWHVLSGTRAIPIRGTYAEAASGELLALVDSYGALEIAVRDGSAAE